ncbi:MAG TPA: FecR family protein [Kofleriaceae bacterium]|nr:FecR family protein [Kofleriaceae bacterium]
MSHVAPHLWADAFAGKLDDAAVAELDRHAGACERCRVARDRVQRASSSFPALRTRQAPELSWDAIRAKVHWSVSTERHEKIAPRRSHTRAWIGGVVALGAVGALALVLHEQRDRVAHAKSLVADATRVVPSEVNKPAPLAAVVSRLAGDVLVDGLAPDHPFAHDLHAGSVIATGRNGRVDAQFGEASAFAVGPRSTLEVRRFDADVIELAVDGTVDVLVSARGKNQRFVVDAGDRVVEVRGTRFQVVSAATGTTVACQHGLVAVRDVNATGELDVGAARKVIVPTGHAVGDAHAVPLTADELAELARTTPWATPGWTADLSARTAPLDIAGGRDVRVDGVELGTAPFALRVAPGRHTIEAADAAGHYKRAGWVDVAAGTAPAHFAANLAGDAPPADAARVRGNQLHAGVDRARLAQCTRAIAKQGVTGAYVQIEIGVDATGAVSFLNIVDTDVSEATASCVRDAFAAVRFGSGQAATWHERIGL